MATYTYDLNTAVGQVRLYASDTQTSVNGENCTFSDEELSFFLENSSQNILIAASLALTALAADAAKLASVIRTQSLTISREQLAKTLLATASDLRARAVFPAVVNPPDRIFSTRSDHGLVPGTTDLW